MKNRFFRLVTFVLLLVLSGCSAFQTGSQQQTGFTQSGLASYYADKHVNQLTANGERYQHELLTAAHKTLAFGTRVKVTNTKNGKSVVVTINDRGPFVKGRIIDLSRVAFSRIAQLSEGLISVKIDVVE